MKRCPACQQSCDDAEKFCDEDGAPLVDETLLLRTALTYAASQNPQPAPTQNGWVVAAGGVVAGVVLCLFIFAASFEMARDTTPPAREETTAAASRRSLPAPPAQAAALASFTEATPLPPETPAPETSEAEAAPPAAPETPAPPPAGATKPARLNTGPVSTAAAGEADGQTVIRLKDGTTIEAEAAWKDAQGVWYKRGGLVALVEGDRVEAITERPRPEAAQSAASTP